MSIHHDKVVPLASEIETGRESHNSNTNSERTLKQTLYLYIKSNDFIPYLKHPLRLRVSFHQVL